MKALIKIQNELKAPKAQRNEFAKYNYRSCEDILEALKPLLSESGALLTISDEMVDVCGNMFIKACVEFRHDDFVMTVYGFAKHALNEKGKGDAQITGAASSYARKYALNGLFLIDDTKDADTEKPTTDQALPPVNTDKFNKYCQWILDGTKDKQGETITEAYLRARHTLSDKQAQELANV